MRESECTRSGGVGRRILSTMDQCGGAEIRSRHGRFRCIFALYGYDKTGGICDGVCFVCFSAGLNAGRSTKHSTLTTRARQGYLQMSYLFLLVD
uniref:Uncharacterized protein n=1 Tax=Arundo donax TaxID=35708 RepID=A0A0A9F195_ARUDO